MTEERRLAAIMFSDICSFSKIMGVDEDKALSFVSLHNQVVADGAGQYGGRIIKKMGDGLMVEFSSAVNAVRCALAVQEAINSYNTDSAEPDRIFIRIGIHLGDVVVSEGGDLLGDGVNVASRIEPLAEPGGICISRDILDLVQNKISIETVHLGAKELKNISKQVDIYKVLLDAVAGKTIKMAPDEQTKKAGARSSAMKGALIGGGIVLAVLMLLAAGDRIRKQNARKAFGHVVSTAKTHTQQGRFGEALQALDSYPPKFSKLPWQAEINKLKDRVREQSIKHTVGARCMAFMKTLDASDWDGALQYLDPAEVREQGNENIAGRLKLVTGLMKLGGMRADKIRIASVDLFESGTRASIRLELLRKKPGEGETWQPLPDPSKWQLIDDQWYTAPGPAKSGPQKSRLGQPGGGRSGPGSARPAPGGGRLPSRRPRN
jgi:class 3 adenylate cyclase